MARQSINGQRIQVVIPNPQLKRLEQVSKKTGLVRSEIIRRAIDAYLKKAE